MRVRLGLVDQRLVVETGDDGIGGARPGVGHGLRGLADRADVLGGRFAVVDAPDGGTIVRVELPCAS